MRVDMVALLWMLRNTCSMCVHYIWPGLIDNGFDMPLIEGLPTQ